jgi:tRNA(fMet)-specific endonuclease VapC
MVELRYLLDTNICIYIIKARPLHLLERFSKISVGEAAISVITFGELEFGARKSRRPASLATLTQIRELLPALPLDAAVAEQYGRIRADLEAGGRPLGGNDLWIAAHAMALKITLVTNNRREFDRVTGLHVEDWSGPST